MIGEREIRTRWTAQAKLLLEEKNKNETEKKIVLSIGLIEIACLIYSSLLFILPNRTYILDGEKLVSKYGIYIENFMGTGRNGYYLDNSIHADEEELKTVESEQELMTIATAPVDLHHGSYEIEIDYSTDDDTQIYAASGLYNTWRLNIGRKKVELSSKDTAEVYPLYTGLKARGYQITVQYTGNGYLFVDKVVIRETNVWKRVALFLTISGIVLFDMVYFAFVRIKAGNRKKAAVILVILGSLTVFSSIPALTPYLYDGHDLVFHLYRIEAIKNSLLVGQFPNRISYSWLNGYGYATSVFYGELFLYLPALLRIVGFTVQDAYKSYIFLVNIATCGIAFWSFYKILNRNIKSALVGCAAYMLAPYRLSCVFLRAAVGEYTAMIFLPMILYGLIEIYDNSKSKRKGWMIFALGVTGIIQSHVLTTLIVAIFVFLFCLLKSRETFKWKCLKELLKSGGAICVLNLWFIIPFLDYFRYDYQVTDLFSLGSMNSHGAFLGQILAIFPTGIGISKTISDGVKSSGEMSYTLGAGLLAVGVLYLIFRIAMDKEKAKKALIRKMDFTIGFGILAVYMATIHFPWDFLQQVANGKFSLLIQNFQFPWRFLSIASVLFSFIAAGLISLLAEQERKTEIQQLIAVLGTFMLISSGSFLSGFLNSATPFYVQTEDELSSRSIGSGDYIPLGTDVQMWDNTELLAGSKADNFEFTRDRNVINIQTKSVCTAEDWVEIPILYYKGYTARSLESGEKMVVSAGTGNRVRVMIPQGLFR